MKDKLTTLLEEQGPYVFYEFLKSFARGYNIFEDETGIRIHVHYGESGDDTTTFISTRNGFVRYSMTGTSIQPLLRDFTKFVNLKAFI